MKGVSVQQPRVLSIAGTDPTGGAGVQADLKAIAAAGGYGMSVITALVAQNTQGVRSVHTPDVDFLYEQLRAVSDDVRIDAIKIGMLGNAPIIDTVAHWLSALPYRPLTVLDPVMISSSGHRLLDAAATQSMRDFIQQIDFVTPNTPELAALLDCLPPSNTEDAIAQAQELAAISKTNVVITGGHLRGDIVENVVCSPDGQIVRARSPRVDTPHTHGTGCSLSAALATRLAAGDSVQQALDWVTAWLHEAISHAAALRVGQGNGPIDHFYQLRRQAGC